ncbi:MAG: hypothetical protein LKF75_02360 [Bacilli bacterium]|jgi:hypothetical protein|nr:hypothetical protein [Bacilli bacterium]MCH4228532.1 hypothetical protein [Bacilli bacterium]MCH4277332.1 hypothetical protein [Bacilli bacterium]
MDKEDERYLSRANEYLRLLSKGEEASSIRMLFMKEFPSFCPKRARKLIEESPMTAEEKTILLSSMLPHKKSQLPEAEECFDEECSEPIKK